MSDVGICETHNRTLEGLCKDCEILICPSCVLFGPHQKHDILNLKEGEEFLRNNLVADLKKGKLKREFTEKSLLEIREYSLRLDKYRNETLKTVDEIFKNIITVLKERKNYVISELLEKFGEEKENISKEENNWLEKQEITENILSLMNEKNETGLLINSKFIMDGLRKLTESTEYKRINIHNDLDTSLTITQEINKQEVPITISFEEILQYLSKFIDFNDPNILEYRS